MDDSWQIGSFKGFLQTNHLVQDTAQGPYVALGIVCLSFTLKVNVNCNYGILVTW